MFELSTETRHGLTIRIVADESPESPRDWDNFGTMVCWHRRYTLGDDHSYESPMDFLFGILDDDTQTRVDKQSDRLEDEEREGVETHATRRAERIAAEVEKVALILPLYLYDHSGLTMRTSGFHCPWDSGQVGFIYTTLAKVREEYSLKRLSPKARKNALTILEGEVETFDQYLRGDVWGYIVEDDNGDHLESCWGFYGDEYCLTEARRACDWEAEARDQRQTVERAEQADRQARAMEAARPDMYDPECHEPATETRYGIPA